MAAKLLQHLLILFWLKFFIFVNCEPSGAKGKPESSKAKCTIPRLNTHSPETPQQVHLSLTNNMDEMNITWLTFEEVKSFVEYWPELTENKKQVSATMVRHEYRDFLEAEPGCEPEKLRGNFRYIHIVTLKGLKPDITYEYKVGHCDPLFVDACEPIIRQQRILQTDGTADLVKDKVFHFHTFPRHMDNKTFTIAVFGDMGLKRPEEQGVFEDEEGSTWEHNGSIVNVPDSLAPHAMDSLMALVHRGYKDDHPVLRTHLNERSSGLKMNNVQLILHIGDIAYDMHEYRIKEKVRKEDDDELYNLGDRYMQVVEDIAAYVPYMVVAGNHENEEKSHDFHTEREGQPMREQFDPQYEHFESRFNMPRNFNGHATSQYYDFTYGPIWFVSISTEFYYSYSIKKPKFRWMPDWAKVIKQYEFIENSLKKANEQRDKYPWVIVVQHRPFYCTSISRVTCRFNKMHKHGIPTEKDPNKIVYGLEELYNKYFVDMVITGHEHVFELFPPIELREGRPRAVPEKFWWEVQRTMRHIDDVQQELVETQHVFMAYTNPVATMYLVVGRPGNAEEMEKLYPVPRLQRIKYYNRFSYTLLHFPVEETNTKSTLAIRQIDVANGDVPVEFMLEKTFSTYEAEVICAELALIEQRQSNNLLTLSGITKMRRQLKGNQYTKRRMRQKPKMEKGRRGKRNATFGTLETLGERGLIRELLYAMNKMGRFVGINEQEHEAAFDHYKEALCTKWLPQKKANAKKELTTAERRRKESGGSRNKAEAKMNSDGVESQDSWKTAANHDDAVTATTSNSSEEEAEREKRAMGSAKTPKEAANPKSDRTKKKMMIERQKEIRSDQNGSRRYKYTENDDGKRSQNWGQKNADDGSSSDDQKDSAKISKHKKSDERIREKYQKRASNKDREQHHKMSSDDESESSYEDEVNKRKARDKAGVSSKHRDRKTPNKYRDHRQSKGQYRTSDDETSSEDDGSPISSRDHHGRSSKYRGDRKVPNKYRSDDHRRKGRNKKRDQTTSDDEDSSTTSVEESPRRPTKSRDQHRTDRRENHRERTQRGKSKAKREREKSRSRKVAEEEKRRHRKKYSDDEESTEETDEEEEDRRRRRRKQKDDGAKKTPRRRREETEEEESSPEDRRKKEPKRGESKRRQRKESEDDDESSSYESSSSMEYERKRDTKRYGYGRHKSRG